MNICFDETVDWKFGKEDIHLERKLEFYFDPSCPMISVKLFEKRYTDGDLNTDEDINVEDDKYLKGMILLIDEESSDIETRLKSLIGSFEGFLKEYRKVKK